MLGGSKSKIKSPVLIMPSKGIELPVNSLMLAAFFGKSSSSLTTTQITAAFNQGCSQLSTSYNCDYQKIPEIKTSLIINNEAKTLLEVCRMSFNNPSMSALKCKKACQVCPTKVFDGSYCEDQEDCYTPLTPESDWICAQSIHQCQCGTTKCRNIVEGKAIL
jgi:hypothetical protein